MYITINHDKIAVDQIVLLSGETYAINYNHDKFYKYEKKGPYFYWVEFVQPKGIDIFNTDDIQLISAA